LKNTFDWGDSLVSIHLYPSPRQCLCAEYCLTPISVCEGAQSPTFPLASQDFQNYSCLRTLTRFGFLKPSATDLFKHLTSHVLTAELLPTVVRCSS